MFTMGNFRISFPLSIAHFLSFRSDTKSSYFLSKKDENRENE